MTPAPLYRVCETNLLAHPRLARLPGSCIRYGVAHSLYTPCCRSGISYASLLTMKLTQWIVSSLTRIFERYGAWMSKPWSPAIAMTCSLLLCVILSSGLAFQTVTNDSEWLFTPKYNQARQTAETVKSLYPGPDFRLAQVLIEAKDHGNVWNSAGWAAAQLVHDVTTSVQSEVGGTYQDRCARSAQGHCLTSSAFSCTGLNFTAPVITYPTCLDLNSGAAIEVNSVVGWPTPAGTAPHQVVVSGHLIVLGYIVAARGDDSLESALHWESDWTTAILVRGSKALPRITAAPARTHC